MDALMAALVAALLTQASDRTGWCVALLRTRFGRPIPVVAALVVTIVVINGLGAAAGAVIGPRMTPEAQALMLSLALAMASATAVLPLKAPDALPDSRLGALGTSLLALLALGMGDRTQFVTFALAGRTPLPGLAFAGATLGALAATLPAVLLGEARWRVLPLRAIRIGCCLVLLVSGLWIGLGGLGLL